MSSGARAFDAPGVSSGARALVLDFGGVLSTPLAQAFAALADETGVPLGTLGAALTSLAERDGEHPLHALERGELSEERFLDRLAARAGEQLDRPVDLSSFSESYFRHLGVNTGLVTQLPSWRDAGIRLALCTNNVREWEPRWKAMLPDLDELFDVVVDSAMVGTRKPEPRIYEIVLERLGDVPAAACVFVDDREDNCAGAHAAGMQAIRFESNEQAVPAIERALGLGQFSEPSRSQR